MGKIKMDLYVAKDMIRELNAKELKRAWNKFLKEQKNGRGQEKSAGSVKG